MRNGLTILPETYTICMYMRLSNEDDYLPKGKDESGSLEVDPEAAEVVKEIFSMRLKGIGPALIARELNSRGILCPTDYRLSKGRMGHHRGCPHCPSSR